jgi:hypothetical protein
MPSFSSCAKGALLIAVCLLSACATSSVSVSNLYEPNFGVRVLPHLDGSVDPDPTAVANGLYTPRALQDQCYGCSSQSQWNWGSWSP